MTPPDYAIIDSSGAKHKFGPSSSSSRGKGHAVMFGKPKPWVHFDEFPDGGGYPIGFVEWALAEMKCTDPSKVLHLCSGSVKTGTRVDIRPELSPNIVADCRSVPLPDGSQDFIMADPPYSQEYARNLYGTHGVYPKPGEICREAARLLKPGGKFGLMHFQVPMIRRPLTIVNVYGISQGLGYAIKAWTLMERSE